MYPKLEQDLNQLADLLTTVKDEAIAYLNGLDTQPTSKPVPQQEAVNMVTEGMGLSHTLTRFFETHADKLVAASGPRYWGYVVGGTTPAAIAGDWLATVFDQNTQATNLGGDISALVEFETIDLMLQLLGLPNSFQGGFVTGATMANFTGLCVGRQWAGLKNNNDIALEGLKTDITVLSAVSHSSALKSLSMLGLGSKNIIPIKTINHGREAMDIADLEKQLEKYKNTPIILISSAGTVNTVDFDDLAGIAALHKKYNFYWHVDAAFGGFLACTDKYKHLLNGWEHADSIALDCHKWMNVPYDSAVWFVNKKHAKIQVGAFQNTNAPYLGDPSANFNYLNAGPENSRRFRALPAWFSLMAYGKNGFGWIIDNSCALAKNFGERLGNETIFELVAPVRANVVCFSTKEEDLRKEVIQQTIHNLNQRGRVFITPTVYKGIPCLRAAFVNWRTTQKDIDIAIAELQQI